MNWVERGAYIRGQIVGDNFQYGIRSAAVSGYLCVYILYVYVSYIRTVCKRTPFVYI